ncbi:MAG TPA: coproporphyrinogen III oxidase family protein [Syntrophales bacterium]|nr:coproporphyrinogen III oxidase family protein [Syntrophobacterales bacterium]HQL90138.1 coproporphyrinogen III oxidase family protein [Syntrophales bacterium]
MIDTIIGRVARKQFARAMNFQGGATPALPPAQAAGPCLLYIHVPFCEKLCPYCSFNRVTFDETLCREYFEALRKELSLYKERGFTFEGIYAGGGTPTVMVDELAATLGHAKSLYPIREISVETNPNHLTDGHLDVLKKAGVNRLSVGIQSFDDALLRAMDRYEKYGSGASIAARLREIGGLFDTLNADMIFNFARQTSESLKADIDRLLETGVDQVTYYPLMVSTKTRELVQRTLGPIPEDREREFYGIITERLVPPYRFSSAWCFSRKEAMVDEYVVNYDDYAGLGSGSIGYLYGTCYANTFDIRDYVGRVNRGEIPLAASKAFSLGDRVRYDFLMKLFGLFLDIASLRKKYGKEFEWHFGRLLLPFRLVDAVRYDYRKDWLYLTPRGRYYWVVMMREFFTAVNNFRDYCRQ